MSKPDDIPQDVWDAANDLVLNSEADRVPYYEMGSALADARNADAIAIARAILAERERCAKVAETLFSRTPKEGRKTLYKSQELAVYASERIAAAIRGVSNPRGGSNV